jgi:signal transduction histidine kinase/DNA-binding response OmpR family regulator
MFGERRSIFSIAVIMVVTLIAAGGASHIVGTYLNYDFNYGEIMDAPELQVGDTCEVAIGTWRAGDTFAAVKSRSHEFRPTKIPYRSVKPPIIVPPGGYFMARCRVDLSLFQDAPYLWLELRGLAGLSAVYLNDRAIYENLGDQRRGSFVSKEERRADSVLIAISLGSEQRASTPGWSTATQNPFFTTKPEVVERFEALVTSYPRAAMFEAGLSAGFVLVFGLAWLLGLRHQTVDFALIGCLTTILLGQYWVDIPDQDARRQVDLWRILSYVNDVSGAAFAMSFLAEGRLRRMPYIALTVAVVVCLLGQFVIPLEIRRAVAFETTIAALGPAVLYTLGLVAGVDWMWMNRAKPVAWRTVSILAITAFGAVNHWIFVYEYFMFDWFSPLAFLQGRFSFFFSIIFMGFLTYDLVMSQRNLVAERTARLAAEREASLHAVIARTTQMLAHDVRRPFSMLRIGLQMLRDQRDAEKIRTTLARLIPDVEQATTAVNAMIEEVMEIGSTSPPQSEPVSPSSLVEATINEVFRARPSSDVEIFFHRGHRSMVAANAQKLNRALSNIVENAVQAMSQKGILTITTSEDAAAKRVQFDIHNSGSYIAPADVAVVFEAFFTKNKKRGTGLGLAIVKKIVEAHGGSVWCNSSQESGTTFSLTIPTANRFDGFEPTIPGHSRQVAEAYSGAPMSDGVAETKTAEDDSSVSALVEALRTHTSPLRVLLVDDERLYLDGLRSLLTSDPALRMHLEIVFAASHAEAVEIARGGRIDAVVSDIDLGSGAGNGFDVAKDIRDLWPTAKICLHSNRALRDDVLKGLGAGADDYSPKPATRQHLYAFLAKAVKGKAVEAQTEALSHGALAVIEDSVFVAEAWCAALGEEALAFRSPEEFWRHADANPRYLESLVGVITDFHFENSGSDGMDLARKVKERRDIPVVLCSELEPLERSATEGVDLVVGKDPLPWRALRELLSNSSSVDVR